MKSFAPSDGLAGRATNFEGGAVGELCGDWEGGYDSGFVGLITVRMVFIES